LAILEQERNEPSVLNCLIALPAIGMTAWRKRDSVRA
jgi:hypothetical protein